MPSRWSEAMRWAVARRIDRGDDARELGVGYVVVTQKIYPTPDLSSADYEKVFSNKDIDIYLVH